MGKKKTNRDTRYERLYNQLLTHAELLHQSNKRRISRGLWGLVLLPFILAVLIWLTSSSKIVFLIVWVLCMFALSAWLITVEYIDHKVLRALEEAADTELEFDELLPELEGPIRTRIAERRAAEQEGEKKP